MTDQNPQRFSTFIAEHRAGLADADLTSAMQEVAHRCEVDRIRAEFPGVPVVYGTPG